MQIRGPSAFRYNNNKYYLTWCAATSTTHTGRGKDREKATHNPKIDMPQYQKAIQKNGVMLKAKRFVCKITTGRVLYVSCEWFLCLLSEK